MPGEVLPESELNRHLYQPSETPQNPDSPLIATDVQQSDQQTGQQ